MNIEKRLKIEAEEVIEEYLTNRHRIIDAFVLGGKSERNTVLDEAIANLSQNPNEYISKEDTIRFLKILKV